MVGTLATLDDGDTGFQSPDEMDGYDQSDDDQTGTLESLGERPSDAQISDLSTLGRSLTGNPKEVRGALEQAQAGIDKATAEKRARIQKAYDILSASGQGNTNLPLFVASGALLGPSRNFGESLSNAVGAAAPVMQQQRQQDFARQAALQKLGIEGSDVGIQQAQSQEGFLEKRLGMGQQALGAAARLQAQKDAWQRTNDRIIAQQQMTAAWRQAQERARQQSLATQAARDAEIARHNQATEAASNPFGFGQQTAGGAGGAASLEGGPHGDDFLKTVSPAAANEIKALAEGRMAFPTGYSVAKLQPLIEAVGQYDPTFDAVNYSARSKTRNDIVAGKGAQNITSFNTAIGHADTLDKAIDDLNNSNFPSWNKISNFANVEGGNTRYQGALKNFMTAKNALTDELTRAFRGTGGNVHDIELWEKTLSEADSPSSLHAAVKQAVNLLRSRIESVGDTYNRGMGKTEDPLNLLSPKAAAAFKRLSGETNGTPGLAAGTVVDGYRFKGGNPNDSKSWESEK